MLNEGVNRDCLFVYEARLVRPPTPNPRSPPRRLVPRLARPRLRPHVRTLTEQNRTRASDRGQCRVERFERRDITSVRFPALRAAIFFDWIKLVIVRRLTDRNLAASRGDTARGSSMAQSLARAYRASRDLIPGFVPTEWSRRREGSIMGTGERTRASRVGPKCL